MKKLTNKTVLKSELNVPYRLYKQDELKKFLRENLLPMKLAEIIRKKLKKSV